MELHRCGGRLEAHLSSGLGGPQVRAAAIKGGVQGVAGVADRDRDGGGDEECADLVGVGVAVR